MFPAHLQSEVRQTAMGKKSKECLKHLIVTGAVLRATTFSSNPRRHQKSYTTDQETVIYLLGSRSSNEV